MPRKTVTYETQPPPPPPQQPKKSVRFALPAKAASDRAPKPSKRHSSSERERSSKSRRSPCEPMVVAAGLSTVARAMDSSQRERPRPKTSARRSQPPPPPPPAPRRELHRPSNWGQSYSQGYSKPNLNANRALGGYDWARVYHRTTYGWYR